MQYLWVCRDKLNEWFQKNEITGNTTKTIYYGLVCFIHVEGDVNVFKIGCTTNLKTCLQDLQVCHYRLLQVHATIGNVPKKKETELHRFFQTKHIRGEWFASTPAMIDSVCNLKF